MSDFILQDGDMAIFIPAFGPAIVVVQPGRLTASGPATTNGKKICLEGDESQLSVPGCMYMAGPFAIPGTGTLKIASLAPDQKTMKTKHKGKALMLKGSQFIAKFEVQSPAQQPAPTGPIPDAMPTYSGQGIFITTNIKIKAS
jgi:Contractile injection system spike tip protein